MLQMYDILTHRYLPYNQLLLPRCMPYMMPERLQILSKLYRHDCLYRYIQLIQIVLKNKLQHKRYKRLQCCR